MPFDKEMLDAIHAEFDKPLSARLEVIAFLRSWVFVKDWEKHFFYDTNSGEIKPLSGDPAAPVEELGYTPIKPLKVKSLGEIDLQEVKKRASGTSEYHRDHREDH